MRITLSGLQVDKLAKIEADIIALEDKLNGLYYFQNSLVQIILENTNLDSEKIKGIKRNGIELEIEYD